MLSRRNTTETKIKFFLRRSFEREALCEAKVERNALRNAGMPCKEEKIRPFDGGMEDQDEEMSATAENCANKYCRKGDCGQFLAVEFLAVFCGKEHCLS